MLEQQADPGNAADEQVGPQHVPERPVLQVLPEHDWIEDDPLSAFRKTHAELDVLDRMLNESAVSIEGLAADCAQSRPERRRRSRGPLVHMMMQQVPER